MPVVRGDPGSAPIVCYVTPWLDDEDGRVRVVERLSGTGGLSPETVPVVVSGGRGVGGPEGYAVLDELAGLLGGVVGCSRFAANNG